MRAHLAPILIDMISDFDNSNRRVAVLFVGVVVVVVVVVVIVVIVVVASPLS